MKQLLAIICSCLICFGYCHGKPNYAPCEACCEKPCCCDIPYSCPIETAGYNAPVSLDLECSKRFFITGSFVYLNASEENLELGQIYSNPETVDTICPYIPKVCFDYEPGFKVGLGYRFCNRDWSLFAEYFRIHADFGSSSASDCKDLTFCPYWINDSLFSSSTFSLNGSCTMSSTWRLEMDTVDVLLSRHYFVGQCLTFNTLLGLRFASIDQTYNASYNCSALLDQENNLLLDQENEILSLTSNNTIDSWAVGPKAGLEVNRIFYESFRLFGKSSFSILYTNYNTLKTEQEGTYRLSETPSSTFSLSKDACLLRPELAFELGIGWGNYFCCNKYHCDLNLSYEFDVYWNQNTFLKNGSCTVDPSAYYGDLYLHGLVISLRFDF